MAVGRHYQLIRFAELLFNPSTSFIDPCFYLRAILPSLPLSVCLFHFTMKDHRTLRYHLTKRSLYSMLLFADFNV